MECWEMYDIEIILLTKLAHLAIKLLDGNQFYSAIWINDIVNPYSIITGCVLLWGMKAVDGICRILVSECMDVLNAVLIWTC